MSTWLILAVGAVYAYVAADLYWTGKEGLSLAFAGYAVSNLGLAMASR
jgi:hypothetical protein